MAKLNDLAGHVCGNWQVLYRSGTTPNKAAIWRCRCLLCGTEKDVAGYSLTSKSSTKCRSCVPKETLSKPHRKESIYNIYRGMMQRCNNPQNTHYKNYGGRGISVCGEWFKDPDSFISWAFSNGYKDGLTIDRIDNDKDYCPNNCRFISKEEQARNKTSSIFVDYCGKEVCLSEACRESGVNYNTVRWRIRATQCTPQEAFDYYALQHSV